VKVFLGGRRFTRTVGLLSVALVLVACGAATPVASPASAPPATAAAKPSPGVKTSVVYSALSPSYLALWAAKDGGIFQQNGLDVDMQLTGGGSPAMAVFLSGQAEIFQAAGSDIIGASANGADIVVTATTSPVYPFKLEVHPTIKSPADLKGKKIGITSIGDTSDTAVRLALPKLGLEPDKDVTLVAVGSSQNTVSAMLSGALDAGPLSPPNNLAVEAKGFHPLFDIPALKLPVANQEVAGQRVWLASHRAVMQQYIDSLVQATARVKRDRAFAIDLMKKYLKSDDEPALNASYDFTSQQVLQTLPVPTAEQFNNVLSIVSKRNDKLAGFDAGKIIDPSFVQSAADRGLDKT